MVELFLEGRGTQKDVVKAYAWAFWTAKLAEGRGHDDAAEVMARAEEIGSNLTDKQKDEANGYWAKCIRDPYGEC